MNKNEKNSQEDGSSSSHKTQSHIKPEQEKFYLQSLYVAAIEKYFGLHGLTCYAESKSSNRWSFGFEHVETGERILVFPDFHIAFQIDDEMDEDHQIIIDCTYLDTHYAMCEGCGKRHDVLEGPYFYDAFVYGFYLLKGNTMSRRLYESETPSCGDCWGFMKPFVLENILLTIRGCEFVEVGAADNTRPALASDINDSCCDEE